VGKARLLRLKREAAKLKGERAEHLSMITQARQRIGETELEIIDLKNSMLNQVVSGLRDTQAELVDVSERLKAAEDILVRTDIRAPQAGVVMGLNVHTEEGVIAPGQRLLDIVPEDDTLVIEAQVAPNDIDVVYAGLPAQVRLTAFKQRNTPMLDAKLNRVSADSFTDERSGASYFLARVTIDAAELKKLDGRELYPGMGAEVMIKTGKRTTMDYILAPLTDSLRRAFRED
jgi:HlyD family secretion protein/epimerase transport system membrane fusion protein